MDLRGTGRCSLTVKTVRTGRWIRGMRREQRRVSPAPPWSSTSSNTCHPPYTKVSHRMSIWEEGREEGFLSFLHPVLTFPPSTLLCVPIKKTHLVQPCDLKQALSHFRNHFTVPTLQEELPTFPCVCMKQKGNHIIVPRTLFPGAFI